MQQIKLLFLLWFKKQLTTKGTKVGID